MRVAGDREVPWWNTRPGMPPVSLKIILETGADMANVYRGLAQADFDEFQLWVDDVGDQALDLEERSYACDVVGRVRDAYDPKPAEVVFAIEDVLLHWLTYRRIAADLRRASPQWAPFFFRGAVPLGLSVLDCLMFEEHQRTHRTPAHIGALTWMPGLGHLPRRVGASPFAIFRRELEGRRKSARCRFRVWVLDVTFTGSSAFGNLQRALEEIDPQGPPIEMTVAVLLPVEQNVKKRVSDDPEAMRIGLESEAGTPVALKLMKRPRSVRSLKIRIYPVAMSLTEDIKPALELSYGQQTQGLPTYVRALSQRLDIKVSYADRVAVRSLTFDRQPRRGDTAHDWVMNQFNRGRLRGILLDLGLPGDPEAAASHVLRSKTFDQYRGGPLWAVPSSWDWATRASVWVSARLREYKGRDAQRLRMRGIPAVAVHETGHAVHWLRTGGSLHAVHTVADGEGETTRSGHTANLVAMVRDQPNTLMERRDEVLRHAENYLAGLVAERLHVDARKALRQAYWREICSRPLFHEPSALRWWERRSERAPQLDQDLAIGLLRWLERPVAPQAVEWEQARIAMVTMVHRLAEEFDERGLWTTIERLAEELARAKRIEGDRFRELWREFGGVVRVN
jgi:hypothetical protein